EIGLGNCLRNFCRKIAANRCVGNLQNEGAPDAIHLEIALQALASASPFLQVAGANARRREPARKVRKVSNNASDQPKSGDATRVELSVIYKTKTFNHHIGDSVRLQ